MGFQNFDLSLGAIILSSELIFALLIGLLIFGEKPLPKEIIGGLFVMTAVILPNLNLLSLKSKKLWETINLQWANTLTWNEFEFVQKCLWACRTDWLLLLIMETWMENEKSEEGIGLHHIDNPRCFCSYSFDFLVPLSEFECFSSAN